MVDKADPDLPFGYNTTTQDIYAVVLSGSNYLDADFGFSLSLKNPPSPNPELTGF